MYHLATKHSITDRWHYDDNSRSYCLQLYYWLKIIHAVLKVSVDGHERRPGNNIDAVHCPVTYATPGKKIMFSGQCSLDDQLIIRKIGKIGATRCRILTIKCTTFNFRWAGGA